MYIIAALAYAISIFIDVFVYHLKFRVQVEHNYRYSFSLIYIFQYSARFFILIFTPIISFYTEKINNIEIVIDTLLLCHFFTLLMLLLINNNKISVNISKIIYNILSLLVYKNKKSSFNIIESKISIEKKDVFQKRNLIFISLVFISGLCFSSSITFTYLFYFYYKHSILLIISISQFVNMFGSIINLLIIDPRLMIKIDNNDGYFFVKALTKTRILVHLFLILLITVFKVYVIK
jgi:hypothetical protein